MEVLCVENGSNDLQDILNLCSKLKRLEIIHCGGGEYNWLNQRYPTLEYLKLDSSGNHSDEGITMFLELNSNIRKFATIDEVFWKNRSKLMANNVKLDELAIEVKNENNLEPLIDFLNKLHERGVYKKLQLYFCNEMNQNVFNELTAVKGLVKVKTIRGKYIISALTNLEEICVYDRKDIADLEDLSNNNPVNLNRIHFNYASIDDILPFIRRSVGMQKIKVDCLAAGVHFNSQTKVINLRALNKEREQLALNQKCDLLSHVQKILLYVDEKVYLATKWAMNGNDFGLVQMKRKESSNWHHDF